MLGIGTDLVDIVRFREVLRRTPGVADRVFLPAERAYADAANDPAARLAARFAAKEATLKAFGVGLGAMRMADIEVVKHPDGRPEIVLHGDAAEFAAARGATGFMCSLSHTDTMAQAVVVALGS